MIYLNLALKNLFRNLQRTLITVSVLIFGFVGIVLVSGYIYRVERFIYTQTIFTNQNGHITVTKKEGFRKFFQKPNEYVLKADTVELLSKYINNLDGVLFVGKKLVGGGLISAGASTIPFLAEGYDENERLFICRNPLVNKWNDEFVDPNCDSKYSLNEITITKNLARSLLIKNSSSQDVQLVSRTFDGHLNGLSVKLRSFHSTGLAFIEDNSLRAPNEVLSELYQTTGFWRIQVYLKSESSLDFVKQKITSHFPDLEVLTYKENGMDVLYKGMMSFLYIMGIFFLALILGTVTLSLVNSITVTILERSKEIGTMRSIGFSRKQLAYILTLETIIIGVITGTLGAGLSLLISYLINIANFRLRPINTPSDIQFVVSPTWWIILSAFIFFLLFSFLVARLISGKVLKKNIIILLNDSGSRGS